MLTKATQRSKQTEGKIQEIKAPISMSYLYIEGQFPSILFLSFCLGMHANNEGTNT